MTLDPGLEAATRRWIADDRDPDTRAELARVLTRATAGERDACDDLSSRMAGSLTFGTAGLRGPVRAGPNGMNSATVVRTTSAVAIWLRENGHAGGTVVLGRDARHGSELFCRDAARVLTAAGFDAAVLPRALPTPVLAYTIRELGAVAGIQITASHNPPADNGYKLYTSRGAQIVPPADAEIESAIEGAPGAADTPLAGSWRELAESVVESYVDRAARVSGGQGGALRIALTPMHGVGGAPCVEALRRADFTDVHVVSEQGAPDPEFPTLPYPNPEEPGATDAVLRLAEEIDADLAIALDPDADRCALGVRDDGWRMLTGDETGALLGAYILSGVDHSARPPPLVATTIVSSSLLRCIAWKHRVRYDETLTGFKWLVRAGDGAGTGLVFAYEEAQGLCVDPDAVRDKDGISAAVLAAGLAATLKRRGATLPAMLDEMAEEHGVHLTRQASHRCDEPAAVADLMRRLRLAPPRTLAGVPVDGEDLLPRTDAVRWQGEGLRVVIRPSGTEQKVKAYAEVIEPTPADMATAKRRATNRMARLVSETSALLEG